MNSRFSVAQFCSSDNLKSSSAKKRIDSPPQEQAKAQGSKPTGEGCSPAITQGRASLVAFTCWMPHSRRKSGLIQRKQNSGPWESQDSFPTPQTAHTTLPFLCLLIQGQMLLFKNIYTVAGHCHIMGTLQSEIPKKPGDPPPHGTYGTWDLCSLGEDSHLLLSTCTLQRSVSCSTATAGRFTPLLSCEAPAWEETPPDHSQAVEIGKAP